jgi:hypothetical protein
MKKRSFQKVIWRASSRIAKSWEAFFTRDRKKYK